MKCFKYTTGDLPLLLAKFHHDFNRKDIGTISYYTSETDLEDIQQSLAHW